MELLGDQRRESCLALVLIDPQCRQPWLFAAWLFAVALAEDLVADPSHLCLLTDREPGNL